MTALPPIAEYFTSDRKVHQLAIGDVFEFLEPVRPTSKHSGAAPPRGRLLVTIKPWGPIVSGVGPVGPWMFACADSSGVEHCFAVPPNLDVRVFANRDSSAR